MRSMVGAVLLALASAASFPAAAAEPEPPRGVFSVHIDNDALAQTDQNYTSGIRLSYVAPMAPTHPLRALARALPLVEGELRVGYAFGQKIFTPRDISQTQPIPTDQPYAGYLYAGIGFESESRREDGRRILDMVELQIGIVGPHAYGEPVQKWAHRVTGTEEPMGWANQLNDELAVTLFYDRLWGGWYGTRIGQPDGGYRIDLSPHVGAALGNVYTYAAAGGTLRFGRHLPSDYGPRFIRPSPPGTDYYKPAPDTRWYLFTGVEGRAVAQNIFLDGNTFTDSLSVDKYGFVGELRVGMTVLWDRYRLTLAWVERTKEFHGQVPNSFGTLNLSTTF